MNRAGAVVPLPALALYTIMRARGTMPIFDNNRELLDRFRRGERAALAAVYEHYVDDVALLARRGFAIDARGGAPRWIRRRARSFAFGSKRSCRRTRLPSSWDARGARCALWSTGSRPGSSAI